MMPATIALSLSAAAFLPIALRPAPHTTPAAAATSSQLRAARAAPGFFMRLGNNDHWGNDDDEGLRDRVNQASNTHLGPVEMVLEQRDSAFVLIFNVGQQDEGVYTLQGRSSSNAYVLAFERTDDAARFSQLLQAEGFDAPTPLRWDKKQLSAFCAAGAFEVSLVPQGTLITPPSKNEYDRAAFDAVRNGERSPYEADIDQCGIEECGFDQYDEERERFERMFGN